MLTLGPPLFYKKSNHSKIFQIVFVFASELPLLRILAILEHTRAVRAQKPPKKGYFVAAESLRKALDIFNLTTTNAILMSIFMRM